MAESNDSAESVRLLARALEQAHAAIQGVRDEELHDPTPCTGWDVGQLLAHLAVGPGYLLDIARGGSPDWSAVPARVADPAGQFRTGADELLAHWRESDPAERQGMDWQIAEFAAHTWDVVTATGQTPALDPDVAERGLAFMSAVLKPEMRADAFAPEQPAPDDATPHERLAAFAGRTVR
ncbi:MAG: TIGR03086 family metal-binding protein [Nocardioides sp.]